MKNEPRNRGHTLFEYPLGTSKGIIRQSSGITEGALEEAGRAEQHIITEAASNDLKLGEGA